MIDKKKKIWLATVISGRILYNSWWTILSISLFIALCLNFSRFIFLFIIAGTSMLLFNFINLKRSYDNDLEPRQKRFLHNMRLLSRLFRNRDIERAKFGLTGSITFVNENSIWDCYHNMYVTIDGKKWPFNHFVQKKERLSLPVGKHIVEINQWQSANIAKKFEVDISTQYEVIVRYQPDNTSGCKGKSVVIAQVALFPEK